MMPHALPSLHNMVPQQALLASQHQLALINKHVRDITYILPRIVEAMVAIGKMEVLIPMYTTK